MLLRKVFLFENALAGTVLVSLATFILIVKYNINSEIKLPNIKQLSFAV